MTWVNINTFSPNIYGWFIKKYLYTDSQRKWMPKYGQFVSPYCEPQRQPVGRKALVS